MSCIDQILLTEMQREDHISFMVETTELEDIDFFLDEEDLVVTNSIYDDDIDDDNEDDNDMIDDIMGGEDYVS